MAKHCSVGYCVNPTSKQCVELTGTMGTEKDTGLCVSNFNAAGILLMDCAKDSN